MKVAIPDLISNSYFPVAAAVELGFFEREGLDMELEPIFPVDHTLEVLRDGGIDFVGGPPTADIRTAHKEKEHRPPAGLHLRLQLPQVLAPTLGDGIRKGRVITALQG